MDSAPNPQLALALDFVRNTDRNIFLTGRAGTGKTTFLNTVRREVAKRTVVAAPTGVAAINAGGMTLHSLFQLPFGPLPPGETAQLERSRQFRAEKIALIRGLDLLVIDEVSMVRADVLDAVDAVLRRFRGNSRPFGGVQLLLIGDLHQLPPIIKEEEWAILRDHYQSGFFFESIALKKSGYVTIELKHIYRQSDDVFIRLLNKVRDNRIDAEAMATLNSRFAPDFQPTAAEPYITLTTHVNAAQEINDEHLRDLPGQPKRAEARIEGDFPEHLYPADKVFTFKKGAQVMFIKNDPGKRFYNGLIGQVTGFDNETVFVKCPGEEDVIAATPLEWENVKYSLNEKTKEVEEEASGKFTQFPLRLAWAITIHKSQGLTFDRAIIDAQQAFAHGQVYVALSRCRTFEGIVLRSKIQPSSVRTDGTVKNYSAESEKNQPGEGDLNLSKIDFQQRLLLELFDFSPMKKAMDGVRRAFLEHEKSMLPGAVAQLNPLNEIAETGLFIIADRFRPQLLGFFQKETLPETDAELLERAGKAAAYFFKKISEEVSPELDTLRVESDNKAVKKEVGTTLLILKKEVFLKKASFESVLPGFDAQKLIRARANADLDFSNKADKQAKAEQPSFDASSQFRSANPKVLKALKRWRVDMADAHRTEPHFILSTRILMAVADAAPQSVAELLKVAGIGRAKANQFGQEMVDVIINSLNAPDEGGRKDHKLASLEMFKSGKSIDEIAAERGRVRSTIEGHLAHFVETGELSLDGLVEPEKAEAIRAYFSKKPGVKLGDAKMDFGDAVSYGAIHFVLAAMKADGNP